MRVSGYYDGVTMTTVTMTITMTATIVMTDMIKRYR